MTRYPILTKTSFFPRNWNLIPECRSTSSDRIRSQTQDQRFWSMKIIEENSDIFSWWVFDFYPNIVAIVLMDRNNYGCSLLKLCCHIMMDMVAIILMIGTKYDSNGVAQYGCKVSFQTDYNLYSCTFYNKGPNRLAIIESLHSQSSLRIKVTWLKDEFWNSLHCFNCNNIWSALL